MVASINRIQSIQMIFSDECSDASQCRQDCNDAVRVKPAEESSILVLTALTLQDPASGIRHIADKRRALVNAVMNLRVP
jgi:hypothetical protein